MLRNVREHESQPTIHRCAVHGVTRAAFAMGRGIDSGTKLARLSGCDNASQYALVCRRAVVVMHLPA